MQTTTARFETPNGSRYLQQLCKHFAHKVEVDFTELHGQCRFVCGTAIMEADDGGLRFSLSSPDSEQLQQTKHAIESHLTRFAFRENLQSLDWAG